MTFGKLFAVVNHGLVMIQYNLDIQTQMLILVHLVIHLVDQFMDKWKLLECHHQTHQVIGKQLKVFLYIRQKILENHHPLQNTTSYNDGNFIV